MNGKIEVESGGNTLGRKESMNFINHDMKNFLEALRSGAPVCCTPKGEWFTAGFFRRLVSSEEDRLITVAQGFVKSIDELESVPVRFDMDQAVDYDSYVAAAEVILEKLNTFSSVAAFDASFNLLHRLISLRYRLEGVNGGFDTVAPDIDESVYLRRQVREWKEKQPLIARKELTEGDLKRIQETVSYSQFLLLLACDGDLRESFFIWTIRDKMSPAAFIQFPAMQEKITASSLAGRIGRVNGQMLQITKIVTSAGVEKIMTLPFEGRNVNILDDKLAYTFRGNFTLTVARIFEIFANKFARAGDIELLAEGVINWNYLKMGWYDADQNRYHVVDVKKPGWWKRLPVFEVISLETARERFGNHVNGKNWNIAAAASRGSATLDYENTHAYLDIAIPVGNGNYAIYDFGKIANEFPTNMKETLSMFALNVEASVAYPDESIYYSHREHAYYSFPMTPEQGMKCMESITEDILVARENNFLYQIESDNCAKWAQEKIAAGIGEENIPNLFQMHLLATEPVGPVAHLFKFLRKLPKELRTYVLTRLHIPLGAGRKTYINMGGKRIAKSLSKHEFFETGIVYLPAYLHRQQEMGLIGRTIEIFEKAIAEAAETVARPAHAFARKMMELYNLTLSEIRYYKFLLAKILNARRNSCRVLIPQFTSAYLSDLRTTTPARLFE